MLTTPTITPRYSTDTIQVQLWTPLVLRPSLWFDAADISTLTISGTNSVTQWRDKSGFNRHASLATTTAPVYSFRTRNISAVTDQGLALSSSLIISGDATIVMLAGNNGGSIFVPLDSSESNGSTTNNAKFMFFTGWSNGFYTSFAAGGPPNLNSAATPVFTSGSPCFFSWRRRATSGLYRFNVTTQLSPTFFSGNIDISRIVGGHQVTLPSAPVHWETLVFNYALPSHTLIQLEGYLAWKWGLRNALPADHPYINRPPRIGDN
jgi:hypothetical protein